MEAALLAAIYADPASDHARAVYADWLLERGDPRGELIVLQLAGVEHPEDVQRERELLQTYARTWRGPLPEDASQIVFKRGFPVGAMATGNIDEQPAWATFESITGLPHGEVFHLPCLRELVLESRAMQVLATLRAPLRARRLVWRSNADDRAADDARDAFPRVRVLPELESFMLHGHASLRAGELAWVRESWCMPQLKSLAIELGGLEVREALELFEPSRLERLRIRIVSGPREEALLWFSRDKIGGFGELAVQISYSIDDVTLAELGLALRRLPDDQLSELHFDPHTGEHAQIVRDGVRSQTRLR
jgi:uncharacterized protein (TIGR02996 family)